MPLENEFPNWRDVMEKIVRPLFESWTFEIPSGSINGENKEFVTGQAFLSSTLEVYLNGAILLVDSDYTVSGDNRILLASAPSSSDKLYTRYLPRNF